MLGDTISKYLSMTCTPSFKNMLFSRSLSAPVEDTVASDGTVSGYCKCFSRDRWRVSVHLGPIAPTPLKFKRDLTPDLSGTQQRTRCTNAIYGRSFT